MALKKFALILRETPEGGGRWGGEGRGDASFLPPTLQSFLSVTLMCHIKCLCPLAKEKRAEEEEEEEEEEDAGLATSTSF